ncbi:MAG: GNAT family N-acetyltransferase [Desulfobacteraceae bacterium]|nr:MAG: GNAT family N-acetyltransferase [Desulfobacteraceae bacterium]
MSNRYLHRVLFPKSIAVFGAGEKETALAGIVLNNIISAGYKGRIFPVCPETVVKGLKVYSGINGIEGRIDLAVLSVSQSALPETILSCGKAGASGAVIVSREGFPEEFRNEILGFARRAGVRLIGPHSWGILNPMADLNAGFARQKVFPGELAVISQSSAICSTILDLSLCRKIGLSFLIGLGDMIDVDFADLIDYLTNNSMVRAILLHIETLSNLRQFMSAARAAARIKPVIVFKTDRHRPAFSIVQQSAADRLNEISIYDAAFKRAGIVRVDTVEGLFDCAELVSKKIRPKGASLVIITDSKTPGTMAVDALRDRGVAPAVLDHTAIAGIDQILSAGWSRSNPVCTRSELAPEIFMKLVSFCQSLPDIDGVLIILSPQIINPESFSGVLSSALKEIKIPVFVAWMGGDSVYSARRILNDAGISTNETPERAVRAFMYLYTYGKNQRLLQEIPPRVADYRFEVSITRNIIMSAVDRKPVALTETESLNILSAYGFPVVSTQTAGLKKDDASKSMTFPSIVNPPDFSLVMGSRMIPAFGPVLFIGPGGGIENIFRDWATGLPPLNTVLARYMLESASILIQFVKAHSREMKSNLKICEDLLIKLSHLVADFPEIAAIDIHPLMFTENQASITDAKIVVASSSILSPLHLIISPYPNQYETTAATKKGIALLIRPMKPEDANLLQELWSTFSSRTLYYRFSKQIKELSAELLVSLTQIDYDREIALAAVQRTESGEQMLGVGRLYGTTGADIAEFSVVVGDPWQGHGIGAQLLSRLIFIATDRKIKTIWGIIQRENKNMIELARKLNFSIIGEPGDPQVEATLSMLP